MVIAQIDVDLNTAREILLRIRSSSPDSKIVVLTMFDNLHYLEALFKLGIHAYIHKSSSSKEPTPSSNLDRRYDRRNYSRTSMGSLTRMVGSLICCRWRSCPTSTGTKVT